MQSLSPQFGELRKHSNSPVPIRSPSPDIVIRSAILNTTPPSNISSFNKQQQNIIPLRQELIILKSQNKRLKRIIQQKGDLTHNNNLMRKIEQKDQIIENLKIQIKACRHQIQRLTTHLEQINRQNNYENQVNVYVQQNKRLKNQVLNLNRYKEQYIKLLNDTQGNSGKDQNSNSSYNTPIKQLNNNQIKQLKEYFQKILESHISELSKDNNIRLNNIERKLLLIEDSISKLTFSLSNKNKIDRNDYSNSTNMNTPLQITKQNELNRQIEQLRMQNQKLRKQQLNLKIKLTTLEQDMTSKEQKVRKMLEIISRQNNEPEDQNKYRKQLIEQNKNLKQSISNLSQQLVNLKNQKVYFTKQLEIMKSKLQNQKELSNSQTDKNLLRQVTSQLQEQKIKNQLLNRKNQSLNDTLDELRRTYHNTQNDIDQLTRISNNSASQLIYYKTQNNNLKIKQQHFQQQNNQLKRKFKQISNIEVQNETQNLKLRLKINQLERQVSENLFLTNQLKNTSEQLTKIQNESTELKLKLFQYETNQNESRHRQILTSEKLNDEIELLKRTVFELERSREQIMKGSNHTKNQLKRISEDKLALEKEIIEYKFHIRTLESDLQTSDAKLTNFSKQYKRMQSEFSSLLVKQKQTNQNLSIVSKQKDNLSQQYQKLLFQYHIFQQQKIGFEMEKGRLLEQIKIRDNYISQEQHHFRSSHNLIEKQRSQNIGIAVLELIQVKKLLESMNFNSIIDVFKQLHKKQITIKQYQQQNNNIKAKLNEEIQRLRRQNLQHKHCIITLQENVQELKNNVTQLENSIKIANQKNKKLDQTIRDYVYPSNDIRSDIERMKLDSERNREMSKHVRFDENTFGSQSQEMEIQRFRRPVEQSISKLEYVINKLDNIGSQRDTHIVQIHSEIMSHFDMQQSNISRQV